MPLSNRQKSSFVRKVLGFPLALLITLLAIGIMVKLGFWQIDRGQQKQAIVDYHADAATSYTPIDLSQVTSATLNTDDRVAIRGQFSPGQYFLIDNQTQQGRVGYHVVALLKADAIAPFQLPVNLGWVPLGNSRDDLPSIKLPTESVTVTGRVHYPAERPFLLAQQSFDDTLPQRIQYLELDDINQQTTLQLAPFSILLSPDADYGFTRDWPVVVMEPHRHYAYAAQWFGLALAAAVVFIAASRRLRRASVRTSVNRKRTSNNNNKPGD